MSDTDDRNIFKCHCNWHHGMGPNLQCPLHGSRENLHAGMVNLRREKKRDRRDHLVIKDDLERQIKRLTEMLVTPSEPEPLELETEVRELKHFIRCAIRWVFNFKTIPPSFYTWKK